MKNNYYSHGAKLLGIITFTLTAFYASAQLSGTLTIPGSYPTISAAITALNSQGVGPGGVTFNVAAGHTETIASTLSITATGTVSDPIVFQKNGGGANPLITSYTGGTGTPGTATQDGIWRLVGSDYVTIDGIDLTENAANTTNPSTMEYGYALYKASTTDGCQNVTIRNCTVTLNRINNASGTSPMVDGSVGINVMNATPTAATTVLTIASAAGTNSNNRFYSNTIQNCNIGIALIGYADVSPFTNADTGNDIGGNSPGTGNTIKNYGGGATTNPAAAVRTLNQRSINISYNTVNNNDGGGVNHATTLRGIYLNTSTSASATVTYNTVSIKCGATTSQSAAIENASGSTAAGNTINISYNTITNCTYTTATSGNFFAIYNTAAPETLLVNNNAITGNSTAATSGSTFLINNTGAVTGLNSISNNNINGMTFSAASTSLGFKGIVSTAAGSASTTTINANNFQAITWTGTGTGAFFMIHNTGTALNQNINTNTFTNLSLNNSSTGTSYIINCDNTMPANGVRNVNNNSIVTGFNKLLAGGTLYGYYANSTSTATCTETNTGNNFSNITVTGATTLNVWYTQDGTTSTPYGPNKTVTGNTFTNINAGTSAVVVLLAGYANANNLNNSIGNNTITGIVAGGAVTGMQLTQGSQNVSGNIIGGISSTGSSTLIGLNMTSGITQTIQKNKIYDIQGNQTGTLVYGMALTAGTTVNVSNNLIGDLRATTATGTDAVRGISITSTTATSTQNISYNSIYLNATSSGTNFGSSGIFHTTSATATTSALSLRNNVIVNNSTPMGTGFTVAYRRSSTTLTNYAAASNNNLLYAGTPGANRLIFYDGTNANQTLSAFKTQVGPTRESVSVTENPTFLSTSGPNANFLHIDPAIATQVESGAANIGGITDDFDGNTRQGNPGYSGAGTSPDIGADELNAILLDLTPPSITYNLLLSGCGTGDRTVSGITIADASGVPTNGGLRPRIYYKKGVGGAWYSQPGTLSTGNAQNGTWTFTIVSADMGGLTLGDQVFYYVIAQDIAPAANITSNPSAGLVASNVNTVNTHPTTPNSYSIIDILAGGTYTVGAGGNYATLTAAVADFNTKCIGGPIVFSLTDPTYSGSETFPIIINQNSGSSVVNTLTIRPANAVTATISGALASNSLMKVLCNYVTIDGSNNGSTSRDLTITNTSTTGPIVLTVGSTGTTPITNTTVKNTIFINGINTSTAVAITDGTTPGNQGYFNNITFQNNNIQRSYIGVYNRAFPNAGNGSGLNIIGNDLSTSGANAIRYVGIYVEGTDGANVESNLIANFNPVDGEDDKGIWFATGTKNSVITKNTIDNITYTGTGGYGGHGMYITTGTTAAGIKIHNNMVSNIGGDGYDYTNATYTLDNPTGILVSGAQTGVEIYYNTISLAGNTLNQTNAVSCGIRLYNGSAANIRNNIISNNLGLLGATGYGAIGVLASASNAQFTAINYNDYYVNPAGSGNKFIGQIASTGQTTLNGWQTATGQDANSLNIQPVFISPTNLHLDPPNNTNLDNTGTPIVGFTTDFDGTNRSALTPDMGADEFTSPICLGASGGTISPDTVHICDNQTTVLNAVNADAGVGITYQWKVSAVSGGPYSNVVGGSGANTTSYTTPVQPNATYYYIMEAHCSFGNITGTSNEVMVVVNPYPTASASSNAPFCEGGTLNLTGTTDVGTVFTWAGPNNYSSASQNPSILGATLTDAGTYTFTADLNGCVSSPSSTVVVIHPGVNNPLASANPQAICVGGTTNLSASADPIHVTLFTEDFNTGAPTWTNINNSSGGNPALSAWTPRPDGYVYSGGTPYHSNDNSQFIQTNSDPQGSGSTALTILQSPSFSTIGATNLNLQFYHYYRDINDNGDTASVEASTDGINWNNITFYSASTGSENAFATANLTLPPAYDNQPTVYVRFRYRATWDWYWSIDNVSVSGDSQAFTYSWTSNPPGFTSTQANPSGVAPVTTTDYTVVMTTINNCSNTATVTVTVNPNPVVNLGNDTAYCQGTTFSHLYDAGNPGSSYTWSTSAQTQTITVTSPGTYSVLVTDGNSCQGSDTVTVLQNAAPVVALGNDTAYCQGVNFSTTLNAGNPGASYSWSTSAQTQTINVSNAGTYSVTVTDGNNCQGTDTLIVAQNANPTVSIGNDTAYCQGSNFSVVLNAGNPGASYNWSTSAQTQTINANSAGTYSVIVTDGNGCVGYDTAVVTQNPSPVVNLGPDINSPSAPVLLDAGNPGASYDWSTNAVTQTINVNISGTYSVEVTNGFGCTGSDTINVTITLHTVNQDGSGMTLTLYPNPSTEIANIGIENLQAEKLEIALMDMSGRLISNTQIENPAATFVHPMHVQDLPAGSYLVRLTTEHGSDILRMIKK